MERRRLLWNWHIDYLCEILEAVTLRQFRRVIINMPPRFLKSEVVSQTWHAWMIGKEDSPRSSMLSAGATAQLAERDSRKTLSLVTSEWYKALFPQVEVTREAVQEWETKGLATRNAAGAGGTITGRGGEHLLWDDLLLAAEANSETIRTTKNHWLGETFRSRLDDLKTGTITGIMQRLHEDDPTGYLLKQARNPDADQYQHIVIPLIAPKLTIVQMPGGKVIRTRPAGDMLHPERVGLKEAKALKAALQTNFEGQYQQNPVKQEGDMLKPSRMVLIEGDAKEIAKKWGLRPNFYIDLASKERQTQKDDPDYTAIVVMGVDELRRIWILDVWAEQAPPDKVCETIIAMHKKWQPVRVKAEAGAILNMLRVMLMERGRAAGHPVWVEDLSPASDKVTRAIPLQNFLNTGQICAPAGARWLPHLQDEMRRFPKGSHDDQCIDIHAIIHTMRGCIPINQVTTQDQVLTRQGWKRVLWSGQTGIQPVMSVGLLTGTHSHPVWTANRGWVRLGSLQDTDVLVCVENPSFLTVEHTTVIPMHLGERSASISTPTISGRPLLGRFTGTCGWLPAAVFRLVGMCITALERTITAYRRWIATLLPFTASNTGIRTTQRASKNASGQAGIALEKAHPSSQPSELPSAQPPSSVSSPSESVVRLVESSLQPAQTAAPSTSTITVAELKRRVARNAASNFDTNVDTSRVPVFNLRVEDCPEFFANGILVHNCDAAGYGCADLQDLRQGSSPRDSKYLSDDQMRQEEQKYLKESLKRAAEARKNGTEDPIAASRRAG